MKEVLKNYSGISLLLLLLQFSILQGVAQTSLTAELKTSLLRGKKVYDQYCLSCHQANGSGVQSLYPPLTKTSFVLGEPSALIAILLNGLNEEIEINGEYYSNPMPAFSGTLNDQEMADVLTFIRNNFGNKATAITAAKVKAVKGSFK